MNYLRRWVRIFRKKKIKCIGLIRIVASESEANLRPASLARFFFLVWEMYLEVDSTVLPLAYDGKFPIF